MSKPFKDANMVPIVIVKFWKICVTSAFSMVFKIPFTILHSHMQVPQIFQFGYREIFACIFLMHFAPKLVY